MSTDINYLQYLNETFKTAENFTESKNYYYENHKCQKNGDNKKIMLDFIISNETTDKILRFGFCNDCKTVFYHKDYKSKSF